MFAISRQILRLPGRYNSSFTSTSRHWTMNRGNTARDISQGRDPLHQAFEQAEKINRNPQWAGPLDAAAAHAEPRTKAPRDDVSGNPEGIGFAEQVGSQSASIHAGILATSHEGFSGQESITQPSLTDAVKNKLDLKTTAGEDKQNRGGGEGVTGSGKPRFDSGKRLMSTSAILSKDKTTKGQAPQASRQPKDKTNADQNEHITHRSSSAKDGKRGKGNTAENPTLPSHQFDNKKDSSGKRGFATSACAAAGGKTRHTAESYFKDVDSTPPISSKTHQVDSSAAGAPVQRANEPQTGDFTKRGPGTKDYETVSKERQPYDTPPSTGAEQDQKLRYGGVSGIDSEESHGGGGRSTSKEGPQGASKGGRKPEGRLDS